MFLSMSAILYLSINLDQIRFTTREICELAMLVGLAVVLNFFPKIPLAWAGSINFQIVPLVIIALRFSPFKTFMASGMIFGLITLKNVRDQQGFCLIFKILFRLYKGENYE